MLRYQRLFPGTLREPDILIVSPENIPSDLKGYPQRLDVVMEVVSAGAEARKPDYEAMRRDYAQAGIAEYWIVDPKQRLITVLGWQNENYITLGEYSVAQVATGRYWQGFSIAVDQVLSLGSK